MKIIYRYILLVFCLFISAYSLYAQVKPKTDLSKRTYVGNDFLPKNIDKVMRSKSKNIDWEKLKNKVVLLDFFETSCGTCIETMPKLQQLRDKYPDKFEVIVVTWQSKEAMEKFFKGNRFLIEHQVNLPVIYGDNQLNELFPHQSVPHAVLIYQGKVAAITMSNFIVEENILKLYESGHLKLPLKDDFGKPALSPDFDEQKTKLKMGITISGYQDGVPYRSWTFEKDSTSGMIKSSLYNASIFTALKALASKAKFKQSLFIPRMDRVVWKVRDSTRYYNFANDPYWDMANKICYERYDSIVRPDSLQALNVLKDFETFFGVKVYNGMKRMRGLVLKPTGIIRTYNAPKNQEGMVYNGTAVFAGFTDLSGVFPPVVDNVRSEVKMEIYPYKTLDELNMQLAAYGIKAEYGIADIEVLVIEEL